MGPRLQAAPGAALLGAAPQRAAAEAFEAKEEMDGVMEEQQQEEEEGALLLNAAEAEAEAEAEAPMTGAVAPPHGSAGGAPARTPGPAPLNGSSGFVGATSSPEVEDAFAQLAQGIDVPIPMHLGIHETAEAGPGDSREAAPRWGGAAGAEAAEAEAEAGEEAAAAEAGAGAEAAAEAGAGAEAAAAEAGAGAEAAAAEAEAADADAGAEAEGEDAFVNSEGLRGRALRWFLFPA